MDSRDTDRPRFWRIKCCFVIIVLRIEKPYRPATINLIDWKDSDVVFLNDFRRSPF